MIEFLPENRFDCDLKICRFSMTLTINDARLGGNEHFFTRISYSSSIGTSLTRIRTNLFLKASESSLRPPYPSVGF